MKHWMFDPKLCLFWGFTMSALSKLNPHLQSDPPSQPPVCRLKSFSTDSSGRQPVLLYGAPRYLPGVPVLFWGDRVMGSCPQPFPLPQTSNLPGHISGTPRIG